MQKLAEEYNDTVIYPDKVRLNCYYHRQGHQDAIMLGAGAEDGVFGGGDLERNYGNAERGMFSEEFGL